MKLKEKILNEYLRKIYPPEFNVYPGSQGYELYNQTKSDFIAGFEKAREMAKKLHESNRVNDWSRGSMTLKEKLADEWMNKQSEINETCNVDLRDLYPNVFIAGFEKARQLAAKEAHKQSEAGMMCVNLEEIIMMLGEEEI